MGLYQKCPNYSPGVKFDPALGGHTFTWVYIWKTLEISVPSHEAQAYQILHAASSSGPLRRVPKLMPWGQIWPHPGGHKFYLGL